MAFGPPKKKSPKELREAERARAKRAALRALRKARALTEESGAKLSNWEGEFLGSVEGRVEIYGRAFADPEKGPLGASLSIRQSIKIREIAAKAKNRGKARFSQRGGISTSIKK